MNLTFIRLKLTYTHTHHILSSISPCYDLSLLFSFCLVCSVSVHAVKLEAGLMTQRKSMDEDVRVVDYTVCL